MKIALLSQRDHAVVGQLADAGQQPVGEGVGEIGPGGAVEPDARLRRGERLGGIDAAVDRREHAGRRGRGRRWTGRTRPSTPAASASTATGCSAGSSACSGPSAASISIRSASVGMARRTCPAQACIRCRG